MITIGATECRKLLQETSNGEWLTNGYWMARRRLCRVTKTAPVLDEYKPDYKAYLTLLPAFRIYRRAIRLDLTVNGYVPLQAGNKIIAWADRAYLDLLTIDLAAFWVAGELDPIAVVSGDEMQDETIVAWLMTCRQEITPSARPPLIDWLMAQ